MSQAPFQKFVAKKKNSVGKEELRQQKKKYRKERSAFFEKKKEEEYLARHAKKTGKPVASNIKPAKGGSKSQTSYKNQNMKIIGLLLLARDKFKSILNC